MFQQVAKGIQCRLISEDASSAAFSCRIQSKYRGVKFCVDTLATAEAEDSLLTAINIYIAHSCGKRKEKLSKFDQIVEVTEVKENVVVAPDPAGHAECSKKVTKKNKKTKVEKIKIPKGDVEGININKESKRLAKLEAKRIKEEAKRAKKTTNPNCSY